MREKRRACGRGREGRGVGERGYLVSEICARDYRSGRPPGGVALRGADSDERDSYCRYCGPGTSGHDGDEGADGAGGEEEYLGGYDLHPVIYHHRHDSADHPCSGDGSDEEEDEYGGAHGADVVHYSVLEVGPLDLVEYHGYGDHDTGCKEERHLTGPVEGASAEDSDYNRKGCGQEREGYQRDPHGRYFTGVY